MNDRLVAAVLGALLATGLIPTAGTAQFGPVEALANRVSDLSFYFGTGALAGGSGLDPNRFGIRTFGVELLFEAAAIPSPEARRRRASAPSGTQQVLRRVEIRQSEGRVDTVYHYDIEPIRPPAYGPGDILWTMEVGLGYGQTEGLSLRDPTLQLNATVRSLPAVTLYLSYEPLGTYLGLRTGFMRTDALQVVDRGGNVYRGRAEAFMMGALAGYALPLNPVFLFVEGGYTLRSFPSVEWTSAPGPLPTGIPLTLDVSGWSVAVGIQFPVR
jgi:hypothetical protein